jgi:hypothetical protein
MSDVAELDTAPQTIEASLNYYLDTGETPISLVAGPGGIDRRLSGGQSEAHRMVLRNGRLMADKFDIEKHGFRFVHHPTKVVDFYDDDEVRRVYYPEMEALIRQEAGAKRVVVFDHTLRTQDEAQRETRQIRDVVRRVHNDYTEFSAAKRVCDTASRSSNAGDRSACRSKAGRWRSATRRRSTRKTWW